MKEVIYIESVLVDNFLITLLLLVLASNVLKLRQNKIFQLFASVFSSIITLLYPIFNLDGIATFIFKISLGYVICYISAIDKKAKIILKLYICFLLFTCIFAGVYFAIYYSLLVPLKIFKIPIGFFFLIVFLVAKISFKCIRRYLEPEINEFSFDCFMRINKKELPFKAYLDTGNFLIDSYTGQPIILVQFSKLREVLDSSQIYDLLRNQDKVDFLKNIHIIPCKTINKVSKILVFEPCKFEINKKGKKKSLKCVVGISFSPIFEDLRYDAIIGKSVMEV